MKYCARQACLTEPAGEQKQWQWLGWHVASALD
ncbi:MAG: hypothetical protein ACJA01_003942 [Saprospiraceae bacterium]